MEEHIYKLKSPDLTPLPEASEKLGKLKVIESTEVKEASEKPLEVSDRPHSASYFQVPAWGELLLNPVLDVNGVKDKIVFIESHLKDKLTNSGMKTDSPSYFKFLSELETYLNLDKVVHEPSYRVSKVYQMLKSLENAKIASEDRKKYLESILSR